MLQVPEEPSRGDTCARSWYCPGRSPRGTGGPSALWIWGLLADCPPHGSLALQNLGDPLDVSVCSVHRAKPGYRLPLENTCLAELGHCGCERRLLWSVREGRRCLCPPGFRQYRPKCAISLPAGDNSLLPRSLTQGQIRSRSMDRAHCGALPASPAWAPGGRVMGAGQGSPADPGPSSASIVY